jgi:hypothetical protein
MKTYMVSYDLDKPGQNYTRLIGRLEALGAFRVLMSQWAFKSFATTAQVRDDLMKCIDSNDRLLVTLVTDWASFNIMGGDKFKQIAA